MLADILAIVVVTLMPLVIGALAVCALTQATVFVLGLRWRNLRRGITGVLFKIIRAEESTGLSEKQIWANCRRDATRILTAPDGSHLSWIHPKSFHHTVKQLPDIDEGKASAFASCFSAIEPAMSKRFAADIHTWAFAWALLLAVTFLVWLPAAGLPQWPIGYWNLPAIGSGYLGTVGVLLFATILMSIGARLCFRVMRKQLGDAAQFQMPPDPQEPQSDTGETTIGRDDCAVRAINFGGGGFSTIMQLGVTHALIVIQGRAPDAVVGVSAGAVQAAALAEVLQAGDEVEKDYRPWKELERHEKNKLQERRMLARTRRFREFLSACHEARETLFDAVTPDAYQVESQQPLEPLKSPLLDKKERRHREDSMKAESGLIRLYNDLLQLNIPFGTIVRVIRRLLGLAAAGNLPRLYQRWFVRFLELAKIWLTLGSVLCRASPLVGPLRRALFSGAAPKVKVATAESIIFKFKVLREKPRFFVLFCNFITLLVLWLGIGLVAPFVVLPVIQNLNQEYYIKIFPFWWLLLFAMLYVAVPFFVSAVFFRSWDACKTALKGGFLSFYLLIKWTLVLWVILWLPLIVTVWTKYQVRPSPEWFDSGLLQRIIVTLSWTTLTIMFFLYFRYGWLNYFQRLQRLLGYSTTPEKPGILDRLLASYKIADSLLTSYALEKFFVSYFDRQYYGKVDIDGSIAKALVNPPESSSRHPSVPRTVAHYSSKERATPIHVGLAVANVGTGQLEIVEPQHLVVDGLVAAVALAPVFPPKVLGNALYVDGTNVANVPTRALFKMLRNRVNEKSKGVHIYSVVPLPFSRSSLYEKKEQNLDLSLWDVVKKALFLIRFRDARVEQDLTQIYTAIIPKEDGEGKPKFSISVDRESGPHFFYSAWVTPVELEEPVSLNDRILLADKEERRKAVLETVADGCRAALEVMIRSDSRWSTFCTNAVRGHLADQLISANLTPEIVRMKVPGAGATGPGLHEVCENCALNRNSGNPRRQSLKIKQIKRPAWPHERQCSDDDFWGKSKKPDLNKRVFESLSRDDWPRDKKQEPTASMRPTISILFSGGVFRGVYQMGVLNALSQLNLRPDVIAGASVGAITAGMIAKAFSVEGDARQASIARLAAVYLGIDSLILTDRFVDFVRKLTIRAADTNFSIRQADHLFRKYDYPATGEYSKSAREVIAGIERLLYVNPYQLNALVQAIRSGKIKLAVKQARSYARQWLEKFGIGEQVLGADTLEILIEHLVLPDASDKHTPFNRFDEKFIHLLATTTNLTKGELKVLGGAGPDAGEWSSLLLTEGLLASSAFPGVFRPRWSSDLHLSDSEDCQYLDGGLMDNFPIDAVIRFLLAAQEDGRIDSGFNTPKQTPHLIIGASLQIDPPVYLHRNQWLPLQNSWPALFARASELGYNSKLDTFERVERNLRDIYRTVRDRAPRADKEIKPDLHIDFEPLNIEVVTIKPAWLCGTFAFHPMLGFRRRKQAMSIAHGCASTLLRFKQVDKSYRDEWGVAERWIPLERGVGRAWEHWRRKEKDAIKGACWLRPDQPCPFSRKALVELNKNLAKNSKPSVGPVDQLSEIHKCCMDPSTHIPDGPSVGAMEKFLRKHGLIP